MSKLYIAVLDDFPDFMTPTLVAHAVLGAHKVFLDREEYNDWFENSFKKCVIRVNNKEFLKISEMENVYFAHENNTLNAKAACIVVCPREVYPNVIKFAKLWSPKYAN